MPVSWLFLVCKSAVTARSLMALDTIPNAFLISQSSPSVAAALGKNLVSAGVLPQGTESKKLMSQEFLLKNADQRFCANHVLQLFKIC